MDGTKVSNPTMLNSNTDWRTQMQIWGYALMGEVIEIGALVAEGHGGLAHIAGWDRTQVELAGEFVAHGNEPYRRVKDFAALPWATEHVLRGHAPWPGL